MFRVGCILKVGTIGLDDGCDMCARQRGILATPRCLARANGLENTGKEAGFGGRFQVSLSHLRDLLHTQVQVLSDHLDPRA